MKLALNQQLVDELGQLAAQAAPINKRIEEIKAALKQGNEEEIEGSLFRAKLVTQMRETLVAEKVKEFLHPNQLRAATRVTPVVSVKVTARNVQ